MPLSLPDEQPLVKLDVHSRGFQLGAMLSAPNRLRQTEADCQPFTPLISPNGGRRSRKDEGIVHRLV
jgi:hypothetical protein